MKVPSHAVSGLRTGTAVHAQRASQFAGQQQRPQLCDRAVTRAADVEVYTALDRVPRFDAGRPCGAVALHGVPADSGYLWMLMCLLRSCRIQTAFKCALIDGRYKELACSAITGICR